MNIRKIVQIAGSLLLFVVTSRLAGASITEVDTTISNRVVVVYNAGDDTRRDSSNLIVDIESRVPINRGSRVDDAGLTASDIGGGAAAISAVESVVPAGNNVVAIPSTMRP